MQFKSGESALAVNLLCTGIVAAFSRRTALEQKLPLMKQLTAQLMIWPASNIHLPYLP